MQKAVDEKKKGRGRPRTKKSKLSLWVDKNRSSREAFAEELEISTAYLYDILTDRRKPSASLAVKIKRITKNQITLDDLLDPDHPQKIPA